MTKEDKYVLRMVRNDNRQNAEVWWSVFRGRWAVLPLVAVFLFIPITQFCASLEMDIFTTLAMGSVPFILAVLFVIIFINGRYPSYPLDVIKWWWFQFSEHLYMRGWTDKPPSLWYVKLRSIRKFR